MINSDQGITWRIAYRSKIKEDSRFLFYSDIPEKGDLDESTGPPHVSRLHHILPQEPRPSISQNLHHPLKLAPLILSVKSYIQISFYPHEIVGEKHVDPPKEDMNAIIST